MIYRSTELTTHRYQNKTFELVPDFVALEEPLEIRLDFDATGSRHQKSVSITMRTPGHDDELAIGFLFGEGILRSPLDIESVSGCGPKDPIHSFQNIIKVRMCDGATVHWPKLERHFYATSSCGVCGKSSLEALEVEGIKPIGTNGLTIPKELVTKLPGVMREEQKVFAQTGGLHASALFNLSGELICLREDVGRHNALDKIIGRAFLDGKVPLNQSVLFLSGRASFELMQKAAVAGIPMVLAVGAPSSLAVAAAKKFNITLIGFVRGGSFNVYHGHERLRESAR